LIISPLKAHSDRSISLPYTKNMKLHSIQSFPEVFNLPLKKILFITLLLFFFAPTFLDAAEIESIQIKSAEWGWGSTKSEYEITRTKDGYKGRLEILDWSFNAKELVRRGLLKQDFGTIKDKKLNEFVRTNKQIFDSIPIDKSKLKLFLKTLIKNPIAHLDINQLGITAEWLKSNADVILSKDLQEFSLSDAPNLNSIKRHFYNKMTDLPLTHRRIRQYFKGRWTDDHAEVKITINLKDHSSIEVLSDSQHALMIPWTIKEKNLERQTYDIRLSKAILEILPEKIVNYNRIKGDLIQIFSQRIWEDDVSGFLSTLGSEEEFGSQLDPIKKEFIILESDQASSFSIDSSREIWQATLTKKEWPKNISVKSVHTVNGKILDLSDFKPNFINKAVKHILSTPWIKEAILANPLTNFELEFDSDRTLSPDDFEELINNFKKSNNYLWKDIDLPYSKDIFELFIINDLQEASRWLIFPDGTTTLLNFWGDRVLNWSSEELSLRKEKRMHYSGARISPDGKIMHP
jgi:hypothetical protein